MAERIKTRMKVFADLIFPNFAMQRIADALKKYAPAGIEFVDNEKEADLSIIYAYGHRRKQWCRASKLLSEGKKYAVIQLALRSTPNPGTVDWIQLWQDAELVWSYYDLLTLLEVDGIKGFPSSKFYHAPLGVDSDKFKDLGLKRIYTIVNLNNRDESVNEVKEAADGNVFQLGQGVSEEELIKGYNQSKFISGLRRKEGFEMPVIEGMLCGARPIVFSRPETHQWFEDLAIFISEGSHDQVVRDLSSIFEIYDGVKPDEKAIQLVKQRFNWETIIKGFWERIICQL